MIPYFLRRLVTMGASLLIISALVFGVIKLPPGDFLSLRIDELMAEGDTASAKKAAFLRVQYGLDKPGWVQYLIWLGAWPGPRGFDGLIEGNFGWSFEYQQPVTVVVGDTLVMTIVINIATILFIHLVAIPIALYSATHKNSLTSHLATFFGYLGLATPNFLLALILLFYLNRWFGMSIGGMMAPRYLDQGWSIGKMLSIGAHLIVPVFVIGLSGTAAMIRRMKANLLDELPKHYTVTARAKGLGPVHALIKYPFRMALNPFIADIGNLLPGLVSGSILVSLVLSLPTVGPVLLQALKSQDQYLAGFILMFVAALTVTGMLISDLLLALIDPRIRFGSKP